MKLLEKDVFIGGDAQPRKPCMQTMLEMVVFDDNVGLEISTIFEAWKNTGWVVPKLIEDNILNKVLLPLRTVKVASLKKDDDTNFA